MTGHRTDIDSLVLQLHSLECGERASAQLILSGPAAVEPLREFLLEGEPQSIYQPRRWAVETLGALGATDVLIEYLRQPQEISDPAVRE